MGPKNSIWIVRRREGKVEEEREESDWLWLAGLVGWLSGWNFMNENELELNTANDEDNDDNSGVG